MPVNDVLASPVSMKVIVLFVVLVGLAGGCMSIAGPLVGLMLNPNDLTAANFKQVERFGLSAAIYFDCGELFLYELWLLLLPDDDERWAIVGPCNGPVDYRHDLAGYPTDVLDNRRSKLS